MAVSQNTFAHKDVWSKVTKASADIKSTPVVLECSNAIKEMTMKKNVLLTGAAASVTLLGASIGIVNAATPSTSTPNSSSQASTDRIAHYTIEDVRTQAIAKVLNTTPSALEDKLKTETMQQVIKDAGLTENSFHDKVKAQVQTDLLADGYSQTQIDNTLNHQGGKHGHMHMHHDSDTD